MADPLRQVREHAGVAVADVLQQGAAQPQARKREEIFQRRQLLEQTGGLVAQPVRGLAPAGRRLPGTPDDS